MRAMGWLGRDNLLAGENITYELEHKTRKLMNLSNNRIEIIPIATDIFFPLICQKILAVNTYAALQIFVQLSRQ
jgi:hypothetical protein